MNVPRTKVLFAAAALAIAVLSLPGGGDPVLRLLAAAAFLAGALLKWGMDDDMVFTLATGELLVIAVASSSFIAGFLVQCAVIGAALTGTPAARRDAAIFTAFCLIALAGAIVIDRANQVLTPFLVMIAVITTAAVAITGIAELRERRKYAGGGA